MRVFGRKRLQHIVESLVRKLVDEAIEPQLLLVFSHCSPNIWKPRTLAKTGCWPTWTSRFGNFALAASRYRCVAPPTRITLSISPMPFAPLMSLFIALSANWLISGRYLSRSTSWPWTRSGRLSRSDSSIREMSPDRASHRPLIASRTAIRIEETPESLTALERESIGRLPSDVTQSKV